MKYRVQRGRTNLRARTDERTIVLGGGIKEKYQFEVSKLLSSYFQF